MYRSYPLKASSSGLSIYQEVLPEELITSMNISAPNEYTGLYISKITSKNQYLSIVINDYATGLALGSFSSAITKDYQVINLLPYLSTVSGFLTIGKKEILSEFQGAYHFDKENTELEESILFIYPPPAVIKFVNRAIESVGKITLLGKNIIITDEDNTLSLDVIDRNKVLAHNTSAGQYDNCQTPIIESINTVVPDEEGNIDIYTILPMTIEVSGDNLTLVPNITVSEVCPELNKIYPPVNESDVYYSDILTEKTPEWKTWPYFS